AEFRPRSFANSALEFHAHEFDPARLAAPEALRRQDQSVIGVIRDAKDSPREVVLRRPEMQQGLFGCPTNFPGERGKRSEAPAIFQYFDRARGSKLAQARF